MQNQAFQENITIFNKTTSLTGFYYEIKIQKKQSKHGTCIYFFPYRIRFIFRFLTFFKKDD